MQIKFYFDDISKEKTMKIDELQSVEKIKLNFHKIPKMKLLQESTYLFYQNIILNDKKSFKFYKICANDKIWVGKIHNYLKTDEMVFEIFIDRHTPEFIHLIMKEYDPISKLRSTLDKIIPNIINMWNVEDKEISNDEFLIEVTKNKLIMRCEDSPNDMFAKCSYLHDEHTVKRFISYFSNLKISNRLLVQDNLLNQFASHLIKPISSPDDLINRLPADLLEFDLSNIPLGFVNCQYLFCTAFSQWIDDIISKVDNIPNNEMFRLVLYPVTFMSMLIYVTMRNNSNSNYKTSMKSILLESVNYLFDFRISEWFVPLISGISNYFMLGSGYEMEIASAFNEISGEKTVIKLKSQGRHCNLASNSNVFTILDAKKCISCQFGVPVQMMYCINYGKSSTKPKDEDAYNKNHCIEIMKGPENIEMKELLGCGATSTVHLIKTHNSHLALKKPIRNDVDLYPDIHNQCQFLNCKNILGYKELYYIDDRVCMGMKYIQGGSLASQLEKGFSEKEVAKISSDILKQIREIHKRKIIHFDIKCDNIVLTDSKCAKIIDFGISKYIRKLKAGFRLKYKMGTDYYMAPEIINGENCSAKVDIWSFGVVLTEMVSNGKRPYRELMTFQALIKIGKTRKIEYSPSFELSEELKQFIDACLNPNPNKRPAASKLLKSKFLKKFK